MNAFLTGSTVYGEAHEDSDVDLVVLVSREDREELYFLADKSSPMMYGRLNVIALHEKWRFDRWLAAKNACVAEAKRSPGGTITRQRAVEIHKAHGVNAYPEG